MPDSSQTYQLIYWRLRRIQGAADRMQTLKAQYDEAWALAAEEDREKAAVRFVPRRQYLGSGT